MLSTWVILRIGATKASVGARFEPNETLRYAQGDIRHRESVQTVADYYIFGQFQGKQPRDRSNAIGLYGGTCEVDRAYLLSPCRG